MKKITVYFCLMLGFPMFLSAQYSGGNGRGDAFAESLNMPVGIKEANGEATASCSLKQNFPNPFSTVTYIEFMVTKEERISIAVYDIAGRIVLKVTDELMAPGTYTSAIDGTFLNSGLYCCRLSSGNYSSSRLMLLIK